MRYVYRRYAVSRAGFPSVGRDNGRWIYLHLFPLVEQASRWNDFLSNILSRVFLGDTAWSRAGSWIEIGIGIVAVCDCSLWVEEKDEISKKYSNYIFKKKCIAFEKSHPSRIHSENFSSQNFHPIEISRVISKLEKLKDSMILAPYFVPSLISHHPGYAEGIRKKETRGIWWLVNRGQLLPSVLSVINIFKVPRHDNKYVHRKNCLTFPCSPVQTERFGISLLNVGDGLARGSKDGGAGRRRGRKGKNRRKKIPATDVWGIIAS